MGSDGRLMVFSGTSHPVLAERIAAELEVHLGRAIVSSWKNGETRIQLQESVRGCDIYVVQSMSVPVDHHLVELLLMIDAFKRASADRITAVIPYYGYARQERKASGREPISAKVVANMITVAGADRVLTLDLHAPAIEGFFDIPVDHLRATPLLARRYRTSEKTPVVAVSPDAGGVGRAEEFRARVGGSLAIISKQRPTADDPEILEMVGDVSGQRAVIIDDMISTGSTLCVAAELLQRRGVSTIHAAATHGIFAADSVERLRESGISKVFATDSIAAPEGTAMDFIETVSVAPMLSDAIRRIHHDLSVSALFV